MYTKTDDPWLTVMPPVGASAQVEWGGRPEGGISTRKVLEKSWSTPAPASTPPALSLRWEIGLSAGPSGLEGLLQPGGFPGTPPPQTQNASTMGVVTGVPSPPPPPFDPVTTLRMFVGTCFISLRSSGAKK